jgi:hypothetical protein
LKRVLAILTLALILANVAGFYVYFIFRLKEIRKEMRAALKDYPVERLQRITLTKTEYNKAKNDEGEIEWNNFMYDIARVRTTGDVIVVLALRDDAETDLLAFIDKIVEMTKRDNESPPHTLTEYSSLNFTLPSLNQSIFLADFQIITHNTHYLFQQGDIDLTISSPPPRL